MPTLREAWPGNNRFFCNCCITGPGKDTPGLVIVYILLVSMIVTYTIFILQTNWSISPVLPILYYASCFTFNLFLLLTACTDPGIIPRRPFLMGHPEKYKNFLVRSEANAATLCETCLIYRPQRASHCSSCQNCVQVFDHHCSVLGNCIGKRNYRFFSMFIMNLFVNFAIFVVNLVVYLLNMTQNTVNSTVVIIIVSVIGGVIGIPIVIFSIFHLYLCISGRTTREVLKHIDKKQDEISGNQWCDVDKVNINFFEEVQIKEIQRLQNEIYKMRNSPTVENAIDPAFLA